MDPGDHHPPALAVLSLLLMRKFSGAGTIGLTYCSLWLVYYGLAAGVL